MFAKTRFEKISFDVYYLLINPLMYPYSLNFKDHRKRYIEEI